MVVQTTYVGEEADDRSEDNLDRSGDEPMGGNLRMGGNAITEIASLADSGGTNIYDGSVVPQGKLGGPASSLTGYPIPDGDLSSNYALTSRFPIPLATDTDMDLGGTDLTDGTTTVWDATAAAIPQARLGGPASSLTSYPIPEGDLNDDYLPADGTQAVSGPFEVQGTSLSGSVKFYNPATNAGIDYRWMQKDDGTFVATDETNAAEILELESTVVRFRQGANLSGNGLYDGGTTIWDSTAGHVPESAVDPNASSPYDTGDKTLMFSRSVGDDSNFTTSSSSYQNVTNGALDALRVDMSHINPQSPTDDDGNYFVECYLVVNPASDSIDVRLRDYNASTTIDSVTNITGGWQPVQIGPYKYNWTGSARFRVEVRNGDGATTVYCNNNIDINVYTGV